MIKVTGDFKALEELTRGLMLAEPTLKKAAVSAINKTATSVRAFGAREVAKEYTVTQKAVKDTLRISRASINSPARIWGKGSPGLELYQFSPTPKRSPSTLRLKSGGYSPKGGVKVMIHRGQRKVVAGAFITTLDSGHVGIFRRFGSDGGIWNKNRYKRIEKLYGPSPIRILDSDFYKKKIDDYTAETMDKNMLHEAEYFLKKGGLL